MVYQGFLLYKEKERSLLLDMYSDIQELHPRVKFFTHSFSGFLQEIENSTISPHILLVEISEKDFDNAWFPLLKQLLLYIPYCKIIFVLERGIEHCSFYLNQIPFTYILSFRSIQVLNTGLIKAVDELDVLPPSHLVPTLTPLPYTSAVFFSTDGVLYKRKKGCFIHYPNQEPQYTKDSLKTILSKLPGNFIQIHKSYIVNMDYCECITKKSRPVGNLTDSYLILHKTARVDTKELPIGPKFLSKVNEYFLDKYAYPF